MQVQDKIVIVTGAARGIGRAMVQRFLREGAKAVVAADVDADDVRAAAKEDGAEGHAVDVSDESQVAALVADVEKRHGSVDLMCSNAGIIFIDDLKAPAEQWQSIWEVNVMAHVYAVRAALPGMLARGSGYFLHTASAAGLLSQIGSATYSTTKHAAVGFAEWLAITYGDQGIGVSVLCPQAVRTRMTGGFEDGGVAGVDGMIGPEQVADAVITGLGEETFLILPHPEVREYFRRKGSDYDRWLKGMQRLRQRYDV